MILDLPVERHGSGTAMCFEIMFDLDRITSYNVCYTKLLRDAVSKLVTAQEIPAGWMGLDIGPATVRLYREALNDVQTVLWNGPMGVFEWERFMRGSSKIAVITSYSIHYTKLYEGLP